MRARRRRSSIWRGASRRARFRCSTGRRPDSWWRWPRRGRSCASTTATAAWSAPACTTARVARCARRRRWPTCWRAVRPRRWPIGCWRPSSDRAARLAQRPRQRRRSPPRPCRPGRRRRSPTSRRCRPSPRRRGRLRLVLSSTSSSAVRSPPRVRDCPSPVACCTTTSGWWWRGRSRRPTTCRPRRGRWGCSTTA